MENFATHSENGYYNSNIFHRVIHQFMIQTGDPEGKGYFKFYFGLRVWLGIYMQLPFFFLRLDRLFEGRRILCLVSSLVVIFFLVFIGS